MQASGCTVVRQGHLIAVVVTYLFGCAVILMVVGCAGVRSEAPQKEEQGHTEATASEEARCGGTRTYKNYHYWTWSHPPKRWRVFTTNDVPGCPSGGLLSGTDKPDNLGGKDGDDEIHGLGAADTIDGGGGNDVIYGGPGKDGFDGGPGDDVTYGGPGGDFLSGRNGEDVLYGGDGNDNLNGIDEGLKDTQRDELYCGPGKDGYDAGKLDYVESSCEKKVPLVGTQ